MIELYDGGVYLLNGTELAADNGEAAAAIEAKTGKKVDKKEAAKETIAYGILADHNVIPLAADLCAVHGVGTLVRLGNGESRLEVVLCLAAFLITVHKGFDIKWSFSLLLSLLGFIDQVCKISCQAIHIHAAVSQHRADGG